MKHQLPSEWSFYGFTSSNDITNDAEYESQIKLLARFQTIEDFWQIYSHIIRPSALPAKNAIHLFRGHARAMREDPENINGGSFLIRVSKGLAPYYWEQLIIALIGERFPKDVIGIIISSRKAFYNIHIWNQTATDAELRLAICKNFCDFLHLPKGIKIDYTTNISVNYTPGNEKETFHYSLEEDGPVILSATAQEPQNNNTLTKEEDSSTDKVEDQAEKETQ